MELIFDTYDHFISCDWGTSSFRLSVVERETGELLAKHSTRDGIKKLFTQWIESDESSNRSDFLINYLRGQIQQLEAAANISLENVPVIISGMASSSIGIAKLPYAPIPFTLNNPALPSKFIPQSPRLPHDILLVSGLRTTNDIMRGEEIQLIGLSSARDLSDCVCLMPGTHSKHVTVEDHKVVDFKTYMSGEIFGLIASQSILSESVTHSGETPHWDAFREGVELAQNEDFLHAVFAIRTNDILLGLNEEDNYDLLSGLIIGSEIVSLKNDPPSQLFIVGSGPLTERYETALQCLNLHSTSVPDSDQLVIKGHTKLIANRI